MNYFQIKYKKIFALLFFSAFFLNAYIAFAADLNNDPTDKPTLRVMNVTANPGSTSNWVTSLSASPGDDIGFAIYYHVTSQDAAKDVRVSLSPQTSGPSGSHYFTATVRASNASLVSGSVTVSIPSARKMSYSPGTVLWRANQTVFGSYPLLFGQNGSEIFSSGGLRLGDIAPGPDTRGSVVLRFHISDDSQERPSVSISANPSTITQGNSSILSWVSSIATSCIALDGWSGSKALSGSETVSPSVTTTYTISCSNDRNLSSDSVTVYVNPAPVVVLPSVSMSANPQSINQGSASVLTWISSHATSCYASGGWSGNKSLSGSEAVYPSTTTTYSIICSNNQNIDSSSVTIYVNVPSPPPPPPPIVYTPSVSMSANPQSINQGSASVLTWTSSNATLCSASGGWSGYKSTSGSETVYPGSTTTYSLSCSNNQHAGSNSVTIYVNVSIPPPPPPPPVVIPTVSISANPISIIQGNASALSWNSYNATSCYASGGWSGHRALSGSETVYPFTTTTYSITCSNNQNINSSSATVYVTPPAIPPPQKLFATACATDPNYAAIGRSVVFYAAFSGGVEPVRYSWSGDIAGSGASYVVPFSVPGLKLAHVTAVDATGKTATNNCSVYVYPATARVVPPPAPALVAAVPPPTQTKSETPGADIVEAKDNGRDFGALFSSILFTADGNPRSGFLLLMYFFIFAVIMLVLFAGYSMIGKKP